MSKLSKVFSIITIVTSLLGVYVIVTGLTDGSASAPQEAVIICLGIALAIIPYCIARSISELNKLSK